MPVIVGRDRQAHRVAQRFFGGNVAVLDRLAVAAERLHAERGDAAPVAAPASTCFCKAVKVRVERHSAASARRRTGSRFRASSR